MKYSENLSTGEVVITLSQLESMQFKESVMSYVVGVIGKDIADKYSKEFLESVIENKPEIIKRLSFKVVDKSMDLLAEKLK